jgi:membrane protease YdiL (CAAX protease family)
MTTGPQRTASRTRRMVEVTAFVWIVIAVGFVLGLRDEGTNGIVIYLLITTALTIVFQRFVARTPIRWMWVRGSDVPFTRRTVTPIVAVGLAIYPVYALGRALTDEEGYQIAYFALALLGAGAAAWAIRQASRSTWRYLGLCMATAGVIGCALVLLGALQTLSHPLSRVLFSGTDAGMFFTSLLTYVPVVFVMEEVTFRGCLDSHIHHEGDSRGVLSAFWVSALWAWWHMGCLPDTNPVNVLFLMVPMGVFLSIWWRRSGNLAVSGLTHAFADSFRNALGEIPS